MPIAQEEARAKLSLDTSDLGKAKQHIDRFAQDSHKSFLHATSAARGFKGMLHEVINQGGIMGNFLQIAISPIGGIFAAATAGAKFAFDALEKLNQKLDAIGDANAKPITNASKIGDAIRNRLMEMAGGKKAFEKAEHEKGNGPLSALEHVEAALGNVENSPEKTELQRALLKRTKANLETQGIGLDRELSAARKAAGNPKISGGIEKGTQLQSLLQSQIDELEKEAPNLARTAQEPYSGHPIDAVSDASLQALGFQTSRQEAAEKLKQLDDLKKKLKEVTAETNELKKADSEHTNSVKDKEAALGKVLDAYRDVDKKLEALPIAPLGAVPGAVSNRDPITGGITYRGIADRGGIAYNALPGSIGYQSPVTAPALTQEQRQAQFALDLVVKFLDGPGIPVFGSDK